MEIKPDKKLVTKEWLVLATISISAILLGVILQFLIPLQEDVSSAETAEVLWPITAAAIFLMWVISVPIILLWIKNLSYHIEDDRVSIHKGIITKVQQNIPYRSITDFVLHRSLFDRLLGNGSLRIQTAGQSRSASGYEGQLSGLIQWSELHEQLRGKIKRLHPVSESTATAEPGAQPGSQTQLNQILDELRAIRKIMETR